MKKQHVFTKVLLNVFAGMSLLAGSPSELLAAERSYEFCNKTQYEAQSFKAQATLPVLDLTVSLGGQELPSELVKISQDGKVIHVTSLKLAKETCLMAKISTKAMGGPIAHYSFDFIDGGASRQSEDYYPSTFEGEDGTAVLADVIDLQNLNLQREAERTMADTRLQDCKTPAECTEAKQEVVEATANAQSAQRSLERRLSGMKKYLIPAGAIALGTIGGLLVKQLVHYRQYLKALSDKESCLKVGGSCSELETILKIEKDGLTKIGESVDGQWGEFVTEHGQTELKNPEPKVQIELPKYFEGTAPIANDDVVILASLNGLYPRDLRRLEVDVQGKKYPAQFIASKGLVRVDLPNTATHGEYKTKLVAYGDAGVLAEKSFTVKKDTTTPKVTITEAGKSFAVNVSDSGLGFEGLSLSGNNVKIEKPEIKFEGKKANFDTKVKMTKRPASLEVKAHKSVVRQNVRPLSNGDQVIGTNAGSNIKYPEERTPQYPGLTFDELLQKIMGGRRLKGLCCRDSSCLFCHPDTLHNCRVLGFSYWKFTDGDSACYKIKPLP